MGGCVATCHSQQVVWPLSSMDPRTRDCRMSTLSGWKVWREGPTGCMSQRPRMVSIRGKLGTIPLIQSRCEPVDLVLQVHMVLLARARRTTGWLALSLQGESRDDVTAFQQALAVWTTHWTPWQGAKVTKLLRCSLSRMSGAMLGQVAGATCGRINSSMPSRRWLTSWR